MSPVPLLQDARGDLSIRDERDDAHSTTASGAEQNVDPEHALEQCCPIESRLALGARGRGHHILRGELRCRGPTHHLKWFRRGQASDARTQPGARPKTP